MRVCPSVGWLVGRSVRNAFVGGQRQDGERLLSCIRTCFNELSMVFHVHLRVLLKVHARLHSRVHLTVHSWSSKSSCESKQERSFKVTPKSRLMSTKQNSVLSGVSVILLGLKSWMGDILSIDIHKVG